MNTLVTIITAVSVIILGLLILTVTLILLYSIGRELIMEKQQKPKRREIRLGSDIGMRVFIYVDGAIGIEMTMIDSLGEFRIQEHLINKEQLQKIIDEVNYE